MNNETKNNIVLASSDGFELAQRLAKALSCSTMVPTTYQGNIPNCIIALEIASRIGSSVFAVMQHLYIVGGRPAFDSTFLIGTVNSCGRFSPLRFVWSGDQNTDSWGCRAVATDIASGHECTGSLITIGMAKVEGWYGRKGSKWPTMPEQMLQYRAAAFWSRIYAPELSLGMSTVDEARDIEHTENPVVVENLSSLTKVLSDGQVKPKIEEKKVDLSEIHGIASEMHGSAWKEALIRLCDSLGVDYYRICQDEVEMVKEELLREISDSTDWSE